MFSLFLRLHSSACVFRYDIQLKTRAGNILQYCLDWELFKFSEQYGLDLSPVNWVNRICADGPMKCLDWGIEEIYFYVRTLITLNNSNNLK